MNLSWLIIESVKALEIKTFILFNWDFANYAILSCISFCFLINDLYLLIPAVITQIFNPIAKLVISIGIPTQEAKAEMETHWVIVEIVINEWSM